MNTPGVVLCYVHSMRVLVVKVMRLSAGQPSVDSCPDTQVTAGAPPGHNCTSDAEKPHLTDSHIQAHRCIIWCVTLKCVLVIPISIEHSLKWLIERCCLLSIFLPGFVDFLR